ncbi:MAG: glycoside hydrolase family 3 C-terminal domain-containing protein, partial [Bacteroidota bacterium]
GINEMEAHGSGDLQHVSAMALNAGIDMDMVGEGFLTTLKKSLDEGTIDIEYINRACRRILEAKFKLGLFDDPYKYMSEARVAKDIFTDENRAKARELATESFVLLKNQNVLPLKKEGTIALIGPLADNVENMPGTWSVATDVKKSISVLNGLRQVGGEGVKIITAKGANIVEDADYEGRVSVFGKNTYRDDRSEAEMTQEALAVANQADIIVAAMGEASEMSGESSSRTNIDLPAVQQRLLKKLIATGKPVVLVLFTGRPLTLTWEHENVPAILNVWFAGTEAGLAIGDVLFGDVNPSGKLTTTFPQNVGQIPLFYNHKNTGRPLEEEWFKKFRSNYLDVTNEPLYPFGYGLSYSSFEYGDIALSSTELNGEATLSVTVPVTNTSETDGKEVVQLYIKDMVGSTTRPVKELKAFQKPLIKAGETKNIEFEITTEDLKFYTYSDLDHQKIVHTWEPGEFEIMVGGNSRDLKRAQINWLK